MRYYQKVITPLFTSLTILLLVSSLSCAGTGSSGSDLSSQSMCDITTVGSSARPGHLSDHTARFIEHNPSLLKALPLPAWFLANYTTAVANEIGGKLATDYFGVDPKNKAVTTAIQATTRHALVSTIRELLNSAESAIGVDGIAKITKEYGLIGLNNRAKPLGQSWYAGSKMFHAFDFFQLLRKTHNAAQELHNNRIAVKLAAQDNQNSEDSYTDHAIDQHSYGQALYETVTLHAQDALLTPVYIATACAANILAHVMAVKFSERLSNTNGITALSKDPVKTLARIPSEIIGTFLLNDQIKPWLEWFASFGGAQFDEYNRNYYEALYWLGNKIPLALIALRAQKEMPRYAQTLIAAYLAYHFYDHNSIIQARDTAANLFKRSEMPAPTPTPEPVVSEETVQPVPQESTEPAVPQEQAIPQEVPQEQVQQEIPQEIPVA